MVTSIVLIILVLIVVCPIVLLIVSIGGAVVFAVGITVFVLLGYFVARYMNFLFDALDKFFNKH
jgi:hypothetical protein